MVNTPKNHFTTVVSIIKHLCKTHSISFLKDVRTKKNHQSNVREILMLKFFSKCHPSKQHCFKKASLEIKSGKKSWNFANKKDRSRSVTVRPGFIASLLVWYILFFVERKRRDGRELLRVRQWSISIICVLTTLTSSSNFLSLHQRERKKA